MSPAAEQDMKTGRMKEKEGKNAPGPERKSIRMQRNVHPISFPCQGLQAGRSMCCRSPRDRQSSSAQSIAQCLTPPRGHLVPDIQEDSPINEKKDWLILLWSVPDMHVVLCACAGGDLSAAICPWSRGVHPDQCDISWKLCQQQRCDHHMAASCFQANPARCWAGHHSSESSTFP